ncbi:MAG TPA: tRNA (5-methylaminomethyl-2-thiouridine)(34)-methyltransferase MnmD [Hymenobacter sp.]
MSNERILGTPKVEVRRTADGSATLYVPALDELYHSHHGARQESEHVFIKAGLLPLLQARWGGAQARPLHLLEVGLGTGLNALLTLTRVQTAGVAVVYDALETVPLPAAVVAELAGEWAVEFPESVKLLQELHAAPWAETYPLASHFFLTKLPEPLQAAHLPANYYNLIYFDAFAPDKQPELWTEAIFQQLYEAAAPGAVLVSYCAQGQFRRNLRAAGWLTEKRPGPPGKREMTWACKAV